MVQARASPHVAPLLLAHRRSHPSRLRMVAVATRALVISAKAVATGGIRSKRTMPKGTPANRGIHQHNRVAHPKQVASNSAPLVVFLVESWAGARVALNKVEPAQSRRQGPLRHQPRLPPPSGNNRPACKTASAKAATLRPKKRA